MIAWVLRLAALTGIMLFTNGAFAADDPLSISAIKLTTDAAGQQEYSVSLQILLIMTALGFIPEIGRASCRERV